MGQVSPEDLRDAGCSEDGIARVVRLCELDRSDEAVLELRRQRALLMDGLHEQQAKVDCLDLLVRMIKKNASEQAKERKQHDEQDDTGSARGEARAHAEMGQGVPAI